MVSGFNEWVVIPAVHYNLYWMNSTVSGEYKFQKPCSASLFYKTQFSVQLKLNCFWLIVNSKFHFY